MVVAAKVEVQGDLTTEGGAWTIGFSEKNENVARASGAVVVSTVMELHTEYYGRDILVSVGGDCAACRLGILKEIGRRGDRVFLLCPHCGWREWASPMDTTVDESVEES